MDIGKMTNNSVQSVSNWFRCITNADEDKDVLVLVHQNSIHMRLGSSHTRSIVSLWERDKTCSTFIIEFRWLRQLELICVLCSSTLYAASGDCSHRMRVIHRKLADNFRLASSFFCGETRKPLVNAPRQTLPTWIKRLCS